MISILAVMALPVGFLAGGVAFNAMRKGEASLAAKAAGIFAVCALIYIVAPKKGFVPSDNCWTDWDGRSNSTVCE